MTEAQQRAVLHLDGPLLVIAGPGSGKTTVITHRLAHLTGRAGVDPASLLVVTFTRAAADAMKARSAATAGARATARVTFGTFHALAYRILRNADPGRTLKILEEGAQIALVRQLMQQAGLNTDEETVLEAVGEIARLRAMPGATPKGISREEFDRLCRRYREAKAQRGLLDFDDLLFEALEALKRLPDLLASYRRRYRYLMVDEFQDTNQVQWDLIRLLAEPLRNLCVVGDDDQAIYGWRGATPAFLLQFPQIYPDAVRVTLDLNHRCPPGVVAAANRLAAHNQARFSKAVRAVKPSAGAEPEVSLLSPEDSLREAEEVVRLLKQSGPPLTDWAVAYRTNQQAHTIAQALARAGIPFRALGGLPNLYRRWPVQDLLSYLRAAAGESGALEQVINRPNRYVSRAVLDEARRAMARTGTDLLTAIAGTGALRSWQLRPLEELSDHLRRIQLMPAPGAIGYIRTVIGYDDYVREYCEREGSPADEILGLLEEVQRTTPPLPILHFLAQVEAFSERTASAGATGAGAPGPETAGGAGAGEPGVTLVTCHKAKGLEFPCVVVVGAVDKLMPHRSATDLEEERRLMYVAITRAARRLWISSPRTLAGREAQPSPFIAEALGTPLPAVAVPRT